ncbi:hypothetical protein JXO52_10695 [bacterium]|nr:hypothetical protein [bacterium]
MDERTRILQMVANGKVTVEEAEKLLDAVTGKEPGDRPPKTGTILPDYLFVKVISEKNDNVDIKVPLSLIRAGMRLTSLIPNDAMNEINRSLNEQGISFDLTNLRQEDVETLIRSLSEMEVNVTSKNGDTIRVYCSA